MTTPKNLNTLMPSEARRVLREYIRESMNLIHVREIKVHWSRVTVKLKFLDELEKYNEMPVGSQLRNVFDEEFSKAADEKVILGKKGKI